MKLKTNSIKHLHDFRKREMNLVFGRCQYELFSQGLELGAGDGFESRMLKRYVSSLICTELDENKLEKINLDGIKYFICDAERISEYFEPKRFDLVFSSNLLEHLPNVQSCLKGIHTILKDNGIAIHLMPNPVWKFCQIMFFYPNLVLEILENLFSYKSYIKLFKRLKERKILENYNNLGDNIKVKNRKSWLLRKLWLQPHGAYKSNIIEFKMFSKKRWINEFERNDFEIITVMTSPFSSGYRVGLGNLRSVIERLGIGSEYIYVAVKNGNNSPYLKYFVGD